MSKATLEQLEKLLADGEWDKAQETLKNLLAEATSDDERAEIFLRFGAYHMEALTKINQSFLAELNEGLTALQTLKDAESKLVDAQKLADLHSKIKEIQQKDT